MSTIDLIGRYFVERARPRVFVPLAVLLAAPGLLASPRDASFSAFIDAVIQALVFVLAFRIWDDLEDRDRDAREHPTRVMVVAGRTAPFVGLIVLLGVAGITPILLGVRPVERLATLGIVVVALAVWYRLRRETTSTVLGGHVVLLKYPAIAYAVARPTPSVALLLLVYLVACVYEVLDDPALRASIVARRVAVTEVVLASLIATASLLGGGLS